MRIFFGRLGGQSKKYPHPLITRLHRTLRAYDPHGSRRPARGRVSERAVFHGATDPYMNDLGSPVCFILGAVAGIWMTLAVSRLVSDRPR